MNALHVSLNGKGWWLSSATTRGGCAVVCEVSVGVVGCDGRTGILLLFLLNVCDLR